MRDQRAEIAVHEQGPGDTAHHPFLHAAMGIGAGDDQIALLLRRDAVQLLSVFFKLMETSA
jgi:hypothetical protein